MNLKTCLAVFALSSTVVVAADFYVAPNGADANLGTRSKPFGSLQRAQLAVRAERASHQAQSVTVTLQAGVYLLAEPLDFTPADSGASDANPVTYRAQPGKEVEISGGHVIAGWQVDHEHPGVWKTKVIESAKFEQLWVNGQRAIRARTPNYWEFYPLLGVTEDATSRENGLRHTFSLRPKDFEALRSLSPEALRDAQIVAFHKWDTTREWLYTTSANDASASSVGAKMQSWNPMAADTLVYFENFLGALDAPGEWFLARDGWLYYYPRPEENMKKAQVVAPRLDHFLTFRGNLANTNEWVQHLRFEGLKFRHADFRIPPQGLPAGQAAMGVENTAVLLDGAEDIEFTNCAVEHIGSTAFWFRKACRNCRVEHTRMFDLGISGVRIGEMGIVPEAVRTSGITIDNCIIQSGGRLMPHAVGVWIGQSSDNAITHCDISDFFYTAVSVGWRWGYDESVTKRNKIEFNHLHHLGYRMLSDMGGIYTLGPSEGTTVRNNVIHDVSATRYGGWGLYPDEGSTGILFENNLVYNVRDGCIHQHYGKENVFRNNILAFSDEGQVALTRAEPHLSFTFEHNLVYWDTGRLLGYAGWQNGAKVELHDNLYWRAGGKPVDFNGKTLEQWQASGKDKGSIVADPLFVDPEKRDFRLRSGSPAEKIGFKPFDISQAGVYGDAHWKQLAAQTIYPKPYVVPAPEPLSLRDDFEKSSKSKLLSIATLSLEGHSEAIALTSDVAASGKQSLRIRKVPGLNAPWDPHFYLDPHYITGPAHLIYKIRIEPGAKVNCEWRSEGNPYRVGPSLSFRDKAIFAGGKKLADLAENVWMLVEMHAVLGQTNSQWEANLTLPDGKAQSFPGLPCDPDWKEARWVGFSSVGITDSVYELDDFEIGNSR